MLDNIICQLSHWKNSEKFKQLRNGGGNYSLEGFDRHECIYVHIPKAAGISINQALFGNYGGGHKTVRTYKKIFGPYLFNRYFKFTFVRNPYSRLLSAYLFLKNGGFNDNNRQWAAENIAEFTSFNEFVKNWINEENIWSYIHFKPQYSFVCDIENVPEVDFVGKVESIDEDFEKVCNILNIRNNLSVLNKGEKNHNNWREYYSDYALGKVAEIYKRDFELFDY